MFFGLRSAQQRLFPLQHWIRQTNVEFPAFAAAGNPFLLRLYSQVDMQTQIARAT
jgi:hypothetical protein